jgi:hypothetical protein
MAPAVVIAFAYAVAATPTADVAAFMARPTPQGIILLAADVASNLPYPHAKAVAFALGLLACGSPSPYPVRLAQTQEPRRGRWP